jgi:hypothetical protein
MAELETGDRQRAADDAGVAAVFPRGPVRRKQDLATYRIDVGPEFATPGTVWFRVGKLMFSAGEFVPEKLTTVAALPAEVRDALRFGDVVTWGFYPADRAAPAATAQFVIAPDDGPAAADLARMAPVLEKQDARLAAALRGSLFLKHGLFYAAYREASAAEEPGPAALAVMQAALRGMELDSGTRVWTALTRRIDRLPERARRGG